MERKIDCAQIVLTCAMSQGARWQYGRVALGNCVLRHRCSSLRPARALTRRRPQDVGEAFVALVVGGHRVGAIDERILHGADAGLEQGSQLGDVAVFKVTAVSHQVSFRPGAERAELGEHVVDRAFIA